VRIGVVADGVGEVRPDRSLHVVEDCEGGFEHPSLVVGVAGLAEREVAVKRPWGSDRRGLRADRDDGHRTDKPK
jgi:hypothetical protein